MFFPPHKKTLHPGESRPSCQPHLDPREPRRSRKSDFSYLRSEQLRGFLRGEWNEIKNLQKPEEEKFPLLLLPSLLLLSSLSPPRASTPLSARAPSGSEPGRARGTRKPADWGGHVTSSFNYRCLGLLWPLADELRNMKLLLVKRKLSTDTLLLLLLLQKFFIIL